MQDAITSETTCSGLILIPSCWEIDSSPSWDTSPRKSPRNVCTQGKCSTPHHGGWPCTPDSNKGQSPGPSNYFFFMPLQCSSTSSPTPHPTMALILHPGHPAGKDKTVVNNNLEQLRASSCNWRRASGVFRCFNHDMFSINQGGS